MVVHTFTPSPPEAKAGPISQMKAVRARADSQSQSTKRSNVASHHKAIKARGLLTARGPLLKDLSWRSQRLRDAKQAVSMVETTRS